jgi:hypothetical protein
VSASRRLINTNSLYLHISYHNRDDISVMDGVQAYRFSLQKVLAMMSQNCEM